MFRSPAPSPEIDPKLAAIERAKAKAFVHAIISNPYLTESGKLSRLQEHVGITDTSKPDVKASFTAQYLPYIAERHKVYAQALKDFLKTYTPSKSGMAEDGKGGVGQRPPNPYKRRRPSSETGEKAQPAGEPQLQPGNERQGEKKGGEKTQPSQEEPDMSTLESRKNSGRGGIRVDPNSEAARQKRDEQKQSGTLTWAQNAFEFDFLKEGAMLNLPGVGKGTIDAVQKFEDGSACFRMSDSDIVAFFHISDDGSFSIYIFPPNLQNSFLPEVLSQLDLEGISGLLDALSRLRRGEKPQDEGHLQPDDARRQRRQGQEEAQTYAPPEPSKKKGGVPDDGLAVPDDGLIVPEEEGESERRAESESSDARVENREPGARNGVFEEMLPFQKDAFAAEEDLYRRSGMEGQIAPIEREMMDFINASAQVVLEQTGADMAAKPFSDALVKEMVAAGTEVIWSNFNPYGVGDGIITLFQGWENKALDCDTSAYMLAHILIAAGVEPERISQVKMVSSIERRGNDTVMAGHLVLKVDDTYYETTTGSQGGINLQSFDRNGFYSHYSDAISIDREEPIEKGMPSSMWEYCSGMRFVE